MVQFGEMSITGYPVEDLVTRESFVADAEKALTALAKTLQHEGLGEVAVVVGAPRKAAAPNGWAIANNAAYVLHLGEVIATYSKHHLPNYGRSSRDPMPLRPGMHWTLDAEPGPT